MKKWLLVLAIIAFAIPTWFVLAQDSPSPSIEITGANASDLPTITINASVLDSSNRPIPNLTIDNFVLGGDLEGLATIVQVENVTDDSLAFATVLVIDTSTSMSGRPLAEAQAAARLFVESVGENDPIAIVSFDSDARLEQDFTTDKAQLIATIDGLFVRGRTALYDAAVLGAEVASRAPVPRRAMILLSDGAEYGGESVNWRGAGLETARQLGVPVYTIGLGYGTDRTYLQELANGTNARVYESPQAEQLSEIYAELATLFRSQYIISLESDIAGDGTEYEFSLQATGDFGESNVDTGIVRAPIPVPIVRFPDGVFDEAISSVLLITPIILADQEITDVSATIDGEEVSLVDGVILLDPAVLPPNTYTLSVSASDLDGDTGSAETSFETAPLPPVISFNDLPEGEITELVEISLSAESQTPITSVTYSLNDATVESSDVENNFPFVIDPLAYPAGDYELTASATNEAEATASLSSTITIGNAAPRNLRFEGLESEISSPTTVTLVADVQSGVDITSTSLTVNGAELSSLTIDPLEYPAGELSLEATVTDSNGLSTSETITVTIASVAPEIILGGFNGNLQADTGINPSVRSQSEVTISYNFDGGEEISTSIDPNTNAANIPVIVEDLGGGDHTLTVTATDEDGQSTSASIEFTIELPTATPDLNATGTADALVVQTQTADAANMQATNDAANAFTQTAVARQATLDANATRVFDDEATRNAEATTSAQANAVDSQATAESQSSLDAQSTLDAQATLDAQSNADAQSTLDAQATMDAQGTLDAQSTLDAQATLDAEETAEAASIATETEAPTSEPSDTPTLTLTPEPTSAATLTPIGEIVEVDSQQAPPVEEGNLTILLIVCGAGLLLAVFVLILFFGRRRRNTGE